MICGDDTGNEDEIGLGFGVSGGSLGGVSLSQSQF